MQPLRAVRMLFLAAALVVVASACEMRLDLHTTVERDGSGVFRIQIAMDEEFRRGISEFQSVSASGENPLASLETYFACLQSRGWRTDRVEEGGGLTYSASHPFADRSAFDRVRATLACGEGGDDAFGVAGGFGAGLDFEVKRSLFSTRTEFSGSVDLRGDERTRELLGALRNLPLADVIKMRIVAELPGSVTVTEGDGAVSDGAAVWEPALGDRVSFAASSSVLNAGSILAASFAGILGLAVLVWTLAGRRRRAADDDADNPLLAGESAPSPEPAPEAQADEVVATAAAVAAAEDAVTPADDAPAQG